MQTADAIASELKAPVETLIELDEVDFGAWSGLSFDALAADPAWTRWNQERATARPPGGETMADVQDRMRRALAFAAARASRGAVVLVSHAEPIRAAVAQILGFSLDAWARLEISPASVTRLNADATRICSVNQTFG
jgi:probable phosphoglycerate mutase